MLQKFIQFLIASYFYLLHRPVTTHYQTASEVFKNNQLKIPTLIFYSKPDLIAHYVPIEESIDRMQKNGTQVFVKRFDSPHVTHFYKYQMEYLDQLKMFIHHLKLSEVSQSVEKKANVLP